MRKILFRGKRVDNGEWAEGFFYQHPLTKECFMGVHDFNSYSIAYMGNMGCPVFSKVIPETVGQYTGLTDKNGNRIFEGDIFPHPTAGQYKYVVGWDDETASFGWFNGDGCGFDPGSIEVIGNIHDNPELLEGGCR